MQSKIVKNKIEYALHEDDSCPYCNNLLTSKNSVFFDVTSNEYSNMQAYCKPCADIFLRDINKRIASANNIPVCSICAIPPKHCKCKKIDYKLRRKLI